MNEKMSESSGVGLSIGSKIGKFEVRERIGAGGQAIVYKCYDALLDRYIAIKQISSHLAENPIFMEGFRKEAQILAKLGASQPAIVTIHELIEQEEGLFIVMEFIPGHTLETVMNESPGPMERKAGLQILWRLCAALHDVHSSGIIHRDIKPANIIITDGLQPKITDFGVAANSSGQTSMLLGTTKYMAPELFDADKVDGEIDGRVDIYSLGLICYEMFLGREEFEKVFSDIVRDKHTEALRWMKWHGNESVKAPKLNEINPDIPKELGYIVSKMMAKDPAARFKNLEDVGRTIKMAFSAKSGKKLQIPKDESHAAPLSDSMAGVAVLNASEGGLDINDNLMDGGPATAPIPKNKMSLTKKILLGGLSMMALIIILVFAFRKEKDPNAARASNAFKTAMKSYDIEYNNVQVNPRPHDGAGYEKALKEFGDVREKYHGTLERIKSAVMIKLSNARLACLQEKWQEAQDFERDARELTEKIQGSFSDEGMVGWTRDRLGEITNLEKERTSTRKFVDAVNIAQQSLDAKKFDDASMTIRVKIDGEPSVELNQGQRDELKVLVKDVNKKKVFYECDMLQAQADDLFDQGDSAGALQAYTNLLDYLKGDAVNTNLPNETKIQTMISYANGRFREIRLQAGKIEDERKLTEAMKSDNVRTKIAAIKEHIKKYPRDEARKALLVELEIEDFAGRAKKAEGEGDFETATRHWNNVLKRDLENQQAVAALKKYSNQDKLDLLKREADSLFEQGKYPEALEKYKARNDIFSSAENGKKIVLCKWLIQVAVAEQAIKDTKPLEDILVSLEELKEIDPTRAEEVETMKKKAADKYRFYLLLTEGDKYLAEKNWELADQKYEEAEKILPANKDEIVVKTKNLTYEKFKYYGERDFKIQQFATAKWNFGQAQKHGKDTDEIRKWIKRAEKEEEIRKKNKKSSGGD